MAQKKLNELIENLKEVREMTDKGIQVLASAFQFEGAAYHSLAHAIFSWEVARARLAFGWNLNVEGFDHLFFCALEHHTKKAFHP